MRRRLLQTCRWQQRQHPQASKYPQTSTCHSAPPFGLEGAAMYLFAAKWYGDVGLNITAAREPDSNDNKQDERRADSALTNVTTIKRNQFLVLSLLYSSAQLSSRCSAPSSVPPPHCLKRAAAARSIFSGVHVCRGPSSLTLPGNSTVNDSASA